MGAETTIVAEGVTLDRLRAVHRLVAEFVVVDPGAAPIFERLDAELAAAETAADAITKARAIVARQRAMR